MPSSQGSQQSETTLPQDDAKVTNCIFHLQYVVNINLHHAIFF